MCRRNRTCLPIYGLDSPHFNLLFGFVCLQIYKKIRNINSLFVVTGLPVISLQVNFQLQYERKDLIKTSYISVCCSLIQ